MKNPNNSQKSGEGEKSQTNGRNRLISRDVIGALVLIVFVFAVGVGFYSYNYVTKDSARLQFWVGFMFSFTALVVIVVQSMIYVQQWENMRDTLNELRTTRELENRAWVGVKNMEIVPSAQGGTEVVATFVNSGNSPAIVEVRFRGEELEESPPDNAEFPEMSKGSTLALFPNVESPSRVTTFEGNLAPFIEDPKNPNHAWYLYGRLDYTDIFGKRRVTKFCYSTSAKKFADDKYFLSFRVAPTHNVFN
jgi:hypothetical protein